jgi:hypothetical protein
MLAIATACQAGVIVVGAGSDSDVSLWGVPDTATYGQTVTAPMTGTLSAFQFYLNATGTPITYAAYVYAWDQAASQATGSALWTSGEQDYRSNSDDTPVGYTPNAPVVAGGMYVMLFTTSGLQSGASGSTISWKFNSAASYTGGDFVFVNNGNDFSLLNTHRWDNFVTGDLKFSATFTDSAVPEPSTMGLFVAGLTLLAGFARRRSSV